MASRYWVGGGSSTNWAATGNTNWSDTSGGAGNQSVPGASDDVFFDANSGSGTANLSADITILSLDCTGFTGTWTSAANADLTIAGNSVVCTLASGMTLTWNISSSIIFAGTSGVTLLTTAGKNIQAVVLSGVGVSVQLQDALSTNDVLSIIRGTFDANDFNVTIDSLASQNSNARTLSMGNGLWTIVIIATFSGNIWNLSTTTNLTFNKEGADIIMDGSGLNTDGVFAGGGLTYNDVTFLGKPAADYGEGVRFGITGNNTFGTLKFSGRQISTLPSNSTQTVTQLEFENTSEAEWVVLHSVLLGATISQAAGSVTGADHLMLMGITGAGGATFAATDSIDMGGNSGWSISAPSFGSGGGLIRHPGMHGGLNA